MEPILLPLAWRLKCNWFGFGIKFRAMLMVKRCSVWCCKKDNNYDEKVFV